MRNTHFVWTEEATKALQHTCIWMRLKTVLLTNVIQMYQADFKDDKKQTNKQENKPEKFNAWYNSNTNFSITAFEKSHTN